MGGNFGQYRLGADVGGALNSSGSVRGRALVNANGVTPEASDGRNHTEVFYGALDIDLAERTTLGLGYLYQMRNLRADNGLPTADKNGRLLPLPNNDFYGTDWNDFSMHSHDVFADLKHEFDNGGYGKVGLRYSDRSSEMNYAFSGTNLKPNGSFTGSGFGGDVQQQAFAFDTSYSQPFAAWGNVSEYVIGADINRMTTQTQRGRAKFPNMTLDSLHNLPQRDILDIARTSGKGYSNMEETLTDYGVYGKLTLRPIQPLAIIVGGRLSHWNIEAQDHVKKSEQSRSESARFTGYGGAVLDINDNHSLYASYSSLYSPQTSLDKNGNIMKARQGQQYEVGIKGSYAGDRLQTRLSLFQLTDRHAEAPVPNENYSAAIGKRTVKGIEAEINGEITPQWTISAGYTHLKTEVDLEGDRQDGFFLLMPRHSGNLWTTYKVNDQWTVGGGITAMSGFESSQKVSTSGYATVDAMLAYNVNDNLHVQLNINNLLDRNYYKRVGSKGTFNMPGEGRSVTTSLRYDF
ncbi:TonB-dependent receptor [Suttonella sp. R2A3]|nr:TonB-dependent receptor [Suttonella sp. R2A3]